MHDLQEAKKEVKRKRKNYRRRSRELLKRLKEKYGFKSRKDLEDYLDLVEADLNCNCWSMLSGKAKKKPVISCRGFMMDCEEFERLRAENQRKIAFLKLMQFCLQMQIEPVAFNSIEDAEQFLDMIKHLPNPCLACPFRKERRS